MRRAAERYGWQAAQRAARCSCAVGCRAACTIAVRAAGARGVGPAGATPGVDARAPPLRCQPLPPSSSRFHAPVRVGAWGRRAGTYRRVYRCSSSPQTADSSALEGWCSAICCRGGGGTRRAARPVAGSGGRSTRGDHLLGRRGWPSREAGLAAGHLLGLPMMRRGWTVIARRTAALPARVSSRMGHDKAGQGVWGGQHVSGRASGR